MTFTIGEKVVYPNHGVATVENISSRSFGSALERFYLLRLTCGSMTVMVPFSHVADVGLRKVTRNGEVAKVLTFLAEPSSKNRQDWKDRFKENSEKMRDGTLFSIAQVLKCLLLQQAGKRLAFLEKKMLDRARHMLIMEISISRCLTEQQAVELLQRTLEKASLVWPGPL